LEPVGGGPLLDGIAFNVDTAVWLTTRARGVELAYNWTSTSFAVTVIFRSSSTISGQFSVSNYKKGRFGTIPLLSPHFDKSIKEKQTMFEINPVKNRIQDLTERSDVLRGYL
jgi:hypothetical protein